MGGFTEIKLIWKERITNKNFLIRFLLTVIFLVIVLAVLANFLVNNETRFGFSYNDPLLILFNPVDVTWLTFIILYGAIIAGLISLIKYPEDFLLIIQAYTIIALFRLITIYFLPLKAPATTIALTDPFIEIFGTGRTLYNDLFFSGHTSAMFLLFLTAKSKILKTIFLILTILVAACVLVQHVHYTIDVIAAPFFAYTCFRAATLFNLYLTKK